MDRNDSRQIDVRQWNGTGKQKVRALLQIGHEASRCSSIVNKSESARLIFHLEAASIEHLR
jgi:hypothetical protein